MILRGDILNHLDSLMTPAAYKDYCPNGLQVEGKEEIRTIISGVSANQALIEEAISHKADMVLVHHGYFWKGENPCIIDLKHKRIKLLLEHNINLIAYHLPLDGHPDLGNNVQLARVLGFVPEGQLSSGETPALTWYGKLDNVMTGFTLSEHIEKKLLRRPLYIEGDSEQIETVAWCTGAAQDFIETAVAQGVDAFITGEVSERTVDIARETGIHFYSAGHYATERYGIQALGEHLADQFGLKHRFIDIENPV
jgi:dinuclear metal center YbgI/SA1388 family protein